MVQEAIVCAHCGLVEDINMPGQPCARCNCELTKAAVCLCHSFSFIEPGSKVFIAYHITTNNPKCLIHN